MTIGGWRTFAVTPLPAIGCSRFKLQGSIVRLEPLAAAQLDGLAEVPFEPSLWTWTLACPG